MEIIVLIILGINILKIFFSLLSAYYSNLISVTSEYSCLECTSFKRPLHQGKIVAYIRHKFLKMYPTPNISFDVYSH